MSTINTRIQLKTDTAAHWNTATFSPKVGELILYSDKNNIKIGDGSTIPKNLPFIVDKENTASANHALYYDADGKMTANNSIYMDNDGHLGINGSNTDYRLYVNGVTRIASWLELSGASTTTVGGTAIIFQNNNNDTYLHYLWRIKSNEAESWNGKVLTRVEPMDNQANVVFQANRGTYTYAQAGNKSSALESVTYTGGCYSFREYSYSNTGANAGQTLGYFEAFNLPTVSANKTSSTVYNILTSKTAVYVSQGGTGATTKSGARDNLGIKSGTSLPTSTTGYAEGDIFFVYT